jgi:hypothetical protein
VPKRISNLYLWEKNPIVKVITKKPIEQQMRKKKSIQEAKVQSLECVEKNLVLKLGMEGNKVIVTK